MPGDNVSHLTTQSDAIGRYRVLRRLGRGGMGEVYLAEDPVLRRQVAIKTLAGEFAAEPTMRQRFVREAIAASALTHPHVAVIYEAGETAGGVAYISMEYVAGETLHARMSRERLPIDAAVRIAHEVIDALDEAHRHGIVHRDIKPANVMLDERGRVKVLDFGVARIGDEGPDAVTASHQTATGVIVGTIQYMSPEQARGQRVDSRSDLFSAGILLYEMITGRNPYAASTTLETLARIREGSPEPPSSIRAECPRGLDAIVLRCLEKDRDRRYQSAGELLVDIDGLGREVPLHRRASTPLRALAIAAAATFVATSVWWAGRRPAGVPAPATAAVVPVRSSVAVLPFVNMSSDASNAFIADGMSEEIINALAQVPSLNVVSRTSSFAFKGQSADIRTIGSKLGVTSVVEGSVQRAGDRLRITAQLVNVSDGYHLWSDRYDRKVDDIFALEDDIARAVAGALRARVGGSANSQPPTRDLMAYEAYVKARDFAGHWNRGSFDRALALYRQAIERDPSFADAYAGLAELYSLMDHRSGLTSMTSTESYRLATESAQKALAIDSNSSEAEGALGHINIHLGLWDEADRHLRRSLSLNPNAATAHLWLGVLRRAQHRYSEAGSEFSTALRLDPLNVQVCSVSASNLWYYGAFERSAEVARRGLQSDPNYGELYMTLARADMMMGRFAEAQRALDDGKRAAQRALSEEETDALLLALQGKRRAALAELRQVERVKPAPYPDGMIRAYAAAGDNDDALRWMERLIRERPNYAHVSAVDLPSHPAFEPLLRDPRYLELRRDLGLPD